MVAVPRNKVVTTPKESSNTVGRDGKGYGLTSSLKFDMSTWTPTLTNLLILVMLEVVGYCGLRYAFRQVHGG